MELDLSCKFINENIEIDPSTRILKLSSSHMQKDNLKKILDAIILSNIMILYLDNNLSFSSEIELVCNMLKNHKSINYINLNYNILTNNYIHIYQLIKYNTNIKFISLNSNTLTITKKDRIYIKKIKKIIDRRINIH